MERPTLAPGGALSRASMPPSSGPPPGTVLGRRFEIERSIASGGFGHVFLGRDRELGGPVAIKVARDYEQEFERFRREANILDELRHPVIVEYVAHCMDSEGDAYLVTEWIEGETLTKRLKRGPLSVDETLALARRVADGLSAAHAHGIVHRDLKPGNLMLPEGDPAAVKLLDFGIARRSTSGDALTRPGLALGTIGYMAPEQASGARDVDARADIFALGCVLFRCLTGRGPFGERERVRRARGHAHPRRAARAHAPARGPRGPGRAGGQDARQASRAAPADRDRRHRRARRGDRRAGARRGLTDTPALLGDGPRPTRRRTRGGSPRGGEPRYPGVEMVSKLAFLPAAPAPATRSDNTVAPSSEGVFRSEAARASDPVVEETREPRAGAIDAAALEFEIRGTSRYDTGTLLGAGGMGEVRLSLDQRIGRRVARKTMRASRENPAALGRFLREARVQGQLEHPAIVPVYDLDVDEDEQVYFTMKRVRGETLERVLDHLRRGDQAWTRRFGVRRLLSAFAQICLAVDYAHTRCVVHRDLKPANVMLGSFGEVYLLDWGLAKVVGATGMERGRARDPEGEEDDPPVDSSNAVVGASGVITANGVLLGTLGYMAPEQLAGRGPRVDARADVYSLGAILFEILTLTRLREETTPAQLLVSLATGVPPRPSSRAPSVPPELDELCARSLSVRPERRPGTARELAEAVELYLDGEHDAKLRRDLAARHATAARRNLDDAALDGAATRVGAMREALKALALDAEQPEAQRLLLDVLTDTTGEVPAAARPELEAVTDRSRGMTVRIAMQAMLYCLAVLPFLVFAGVLHWPVVGATTAVTVAGMLFARHLWKKGHAGTGEITALVGIVAVIVALTSCYLGPFVIMPTMAVGASLILAMSATRRERRIGAIVFAAGGLLPYVVEILGVVPRAYTFEPGRIVVAARAAALPHWPTMGAMAYSTVAWTLLTIMLVGRMRDALAALERRQFLQAWYLRQLFPASAADPQH